MKILHATSWVVFGSSMLAAQVPAPHVLEGIVVDHSRARIVSATVIVTDEKTLRSLNARSDAQGRFHFSLEPGSYELRIESPCFAPFVQKGLRVDGIVEAHFEVMLQVIKGCFDTTTAPAAKGI